MTYKSQKRKNKESLRRGSESVTDGFIFRYLAGLDTPRSLAVWLLYKHKEHQQLLDLELPTDCEPFWFRSVDHAVRDYLATELLSKADFLSTKIDLKKVAIDKFLAAEESCRVTNRRLMKGPTLASSASDYLISKARRKISDILGDFDPVEFIESVNWGPGATVRLTRAQRLAYDKFSLEGGISYQAHEFWRPLWDKAFPRWSPVLVDETAYVTTVPKNSKTHRTIIIEPGLNTFFQKGLGQMIRRRLARIGINLKRQADVHRELVRTMSRDGVLATIDFSSASDTISVELVRELLPAKWFNVLDIHRSRYVTLPTGNTIRLEKFSSMGNGFTFELESLIFYALAYAVCEKDDYISVFGDDVILPSSRVPDYRQLCTYAGLTVNERKSFSNGYFRESCGEHCFNGTSAKPLYLRSKIRSIHDIFKTANQVRRLSHRMCCYHACDTRFAKAWRYLTGATVGRALGVRPTDYCISEGYGDNGLVVNFDECTPKRHRGYQHGFKARALVPYFVGSRYVDDHPLLLQRLFEVSQEFEYTPSQGYDLDFDVLAARESQCYGNTLVDLSSAIKLRNSELYIPQWYNLGSWV